MNCIEVNDMEKFAFVDVETTGYDPHAHRIIEIGIVTANEEGIEERFTCLLNPESEIPWMVSRITGIRASDVKNAALFKDIAPRVYSLLEGRIFVAHNVGFDYGFVQGEFARLGVTFKAEQLCTVKLSKHLFPQYSRHSLESIIERYAFSYTSRHRAGDDAFVLYQFWTYLQDHIPAEQMKKVRTLLRRYQQLGFDANDTYEKTKPYIIEKLSLPEIAQKRALSFSTIVNHVVVLKRRYPDLDISYLRPSNEHISMIARASKKGRKLTAMKTFLGDEFSYDQIRLGMLFLKA